MSNTAALPDIEQLDIVIIGMGYVGLPLAAAFADHFRVIGIDIDAHRVGQLQQGIDATDELTTEQLTHAIDAGLSFSTDIQAGKDAQVYIVTVPTPIDDSNMPDLNPLIAVSESVAQVLKRSDIVIYESTVYPGVTEDVCVPLLEQHSGLQFNQDFYVGYSPERINPGDKVNTVTNILKITAGSTPQAAQLIDQLYRRIVTAGTHLASSIKVAEAAKVIENTQRDVNIALMNELAVIFNQMGISTQEVLNAAATKWNFIKLTPGLVGGHCIGVDPYYLTFKAQSLGYQPNLILASRQINNGMAKYVAEQTIKQMIAADILINRAKVVVLGITFKENCPDIRNTKVFDIATHLAAFGVQLCYHDPVVEADAETPQHMGQRIDDLMSHQGEFDAVIVAVSHQYYLEHQDLIMGLSNPERKAVIMDIKSIMDNPTWQL